MGTLIYPGNEKSLRATITKKCRLTIIFLLFILMFNVISLTCTIVNIKFSHISNVSLNIQFNF